MARHPRTANRRTARGNRIGLAIVGAGLVLAAVATLIRGLDLVPDWFGSAGAPLTSDSTRDFVTGAAWFWPVVAVVAVVVALLALRWLAVQARTGAVGTLRLESDVALGTTRLPARAVTDALADDLERSPYLGRASATLIGSRARPDLRLRVAMDPAADPVAVRDRLDEALDRTREALEAPELPTAVQLDARP